MSQKINLFNEAWVDLLFKDRNQEYGAFELRKDSSWRHRVGIIATLVFLVLIIFVPILYKQIIEKGRDRNVDVTTLSNIEIEKKVEKPKDIIIEKPAPPLKSSIKFTPPVIKPDEEVQEDEEIKTQEELTRTDLNISVADIKGTDEENGMDIGDLNNMIVGEDTTSTPYAVVEQMPEFPGGEAALQRYLRSSVKYPTIAMENGIQGKVYIGFVVERNGTISNVRVARGVDISLDKEAMRVVRLMPKWIPGKQNGEPVRVSFTAPINFVLE
ncbi:MAG: TonB family protein [Bacteroidota bacterium]|nr:energy transducer TonB [Odoribacter sp.]MDP3643854.1 TonB family protein [Bacteroidota bacterium]